MGSNAAVHENQQSNGGQWILRGTYTLASGTTNVKLTTDTSGIVVADAVKATLASKDGVTGYYVYPDQTDAPRMITRASDDQMVWRWDQADPFGAATPNPNPAGLGTFTYDPRLPGQIFDAENNLNYNDFRNHVPTLGRYVQSDPIGLSGGVNMYAYVGGGSAEMDRCARFGYLQGCRKLFFGHATITWILFDGDRCRRVYPRLGTVRSSIPFPFFMPRWFVTPAHSGNHGTTTTRHRTRW